MRACKLKLNVCVLLQHVCSNITNDVLSLVYMYLLFKYVCTVFTVKLSIFIELYLYHNTCSCNKRENLSLIKYA